MVNNKISNLKAKKENLESDFHAKIPAESDLGQRVTKHIATVKETTYQNTVCVVCVYKWVSVYVKQNVNL